MPTRRTRLVPHALLVLLASGALGWSCEDGTPATDPGVELATNPAQVSLAQGASADVELTATFTRIDGPLELSFADPLPAGLTVAFSGSSVMAATPSVIVTVTAAASAPPGDHVITLRGKAGLYAPERALPVKVLPASAGTGSLRVRWTIAGQAPTAGLCAPFQWIQLDLDGQDAARPPCTAGTFLLSGVPEGTRTVTGAAYPVSGQGDAIQVQSTVVAGSVMEVLLDLPLPRAWPQLTIVRTGGLAGKVTSAPEGIDCGTVCSWRFPPGRVVLTASGSPGAVAYSGACATVEAGSVAQVTLGTTDASCHVDFEVASLFLLFLDPPPAGLTTASRFQLVPKGWDDVAKVFVPATTYYPDLASCEWTYTPPGGAPALLPVSRCSGLVMGGPLPASPPDVLLASGASNVRLVGVRASGARSPPVDVAINVQ